MVDLPSGDGATNDVTGDPPQDVNAPVSSVGKASSTGLEPTGWSLPVRAAPILSEQGESVVEFPLSQHRSGRVSTSLVMDDHLLRLVEARLDDDGIRRLDVRMALVKAHLSGYSHTHLDLFQRMMPVWWTSLAAGLLMSTGLVQGWFALSGGLFAFAGLAGMLLAKLDLHRLSFSDHGGRHDFYLSGWGEDPHLIRNSTALLGPAFVDFLRNGELETAHIDAVVASLATEAVVLTPLPVSTGAVPGAPRALPVPSAPPTPQTAATPNTSEMAHGPAPTNAPMEEPTPSTSEASNKAPPLSTVDTLPLGPPVNPPGPPASLPVPAPPPRTPLPPPNPPVLPPAPLPPLPPSPAVHSAEDALWDDLI